MTRQRGRFAPPPTKTTIWRDGYQWIDRDILSGRTIVTFHNVPDVQIRQLADQLRDSVIPSDALIQVPGRPGLFISLYLQDRPGGVQ